MKHHKANNKLGINNSRLAKTKASLCQFRKESHCQLQEKRQLVDSYNIHLVQVIICMQICDFDVVIFHKEIFAL